MYGAFEYGCLQYGGMTTGLSVDLIPDWPTLTSKPSYKGFEQQRMAAEAVENASNSNIIASSGRLPVYYRFKVPYPLLTPSDEQALQTFQQTIGYAEEFRWAHPVSSADWLVRLMKPLEFSAIKGNIVRYSTIVDLYGYLEGE